MQRFYGQERALIDASGRLKLPSSYFSAFQVSESTNLVLYCLPEGAVGLYPQKTWQAMRELEEAQKQQAAHSLVYRRQLRRFGAMSQHVTLSKQGRITIPALFREFASLNTGESVILAGVEIGIEIWSISHWQSEMLNIQDHVLAKGELEMTSDLNTGGTNGGEDA
jgi:DNA-binding transcriptional regulator/RsmH inhibitor MraZ